jgi:hypothetical protein
MTDQSALPVTDDGERFRQPISVPGKLGPISMFVTVHSPHLMR